MSATLEPPQPKALPSWLGATRTACCLKEVPAVRKQPWDFHGKFNSIPAFTAPNSMWFRISLHNDKKARFLARIMPARDRPLSPARATFSTQPRFYQSARFCTLSVENKGPARVYRIDPVARKKPAIKKGFVYHSRGRGGRLITMQPASVVFWWSRLTPG